MSEKMTGNKMSEVARQFGKGLGEYFKIKDDVNESVYSFESCGVVWWEAGKNGNSLIIMDNILADLMTGRKEIEYGQGH